MIHLSNYHSNGLPTVVWSNKVNLIGEKVYKPKIHFCEHCNKPILIYGRLIPCKHVFCFTCATLCLTQQHQQPVKNNNSIQSPNPNVPGPREPSLTASHLKHHGSPIGQNHSPFESSGSSLRNNGSNIHHSNSNFLNTSNNDRHHKQASAGGGTVSNNNLSSKNIDYHRSDSNHSMKDDHSGSLMNIDESTSDTTPTTIQQDNTNSPITNGLNSNDVSLQGQQSSKGCHRCGGKALRVERNTLNSIFVCQIETCRRTYLSARDLQAHVTHRHSRNKSSTNHHHHHQNQSNSANNPSASIAAISSSPYISSSSLMHLNNHSQSSSNNHRHQSSSSANSTGLNSQPGQNHPPEHNNHHSHHNNYHHRNEERDHPYPGRHSRRERMRDRHRDRDNYQRDRERERDTKEHHRQSLQRAAQWAEASAQMLEKGLTR